MNTWRIIDTGPGGAFYNMALDEALASEVRGGASPPVLRFYGWDRPSATIGSSQRTAEVDVEYCRSMGIPMVRRPTGGRGILHGEELTYSFSAAAKGVFAGGLFESYKAISQAFSLALALLGIEPQSEMSKRSVGQRSPLCFQSASYGEITVGGRKVIGSAQRRWPGGLLQQGSIPYALDYEGLSKVFIGDAGSAHEVMAGLGELAPALSPGELKRALRGAFQEVFGVRFTESAPTPHEEGLALDLLKGKYSLPRWNFRK